MKIEFSDGELYLYNFGDKSFVVQNGEEGCRIYQLDNQITRDLQYGSDRINMCYLYEVDKYVSFTDSMPSNSGHEKNKCDIYFIKDYDYIIIQYSYNNFIIMNDNLEQLFKEKELKWIRVINDDLYICTNNKVYKNLKHHCDIADRYGCHMSELIHIGETRYENVYQGQASGVALPNIRKIRYIDPPAGFFDITKGNYVTEISFGTIKGHEVIRRKNKWVIQEIDEYISRLDKKIQELKTLESKRLETSKNLDEVIEKINDRLKEMQPDKLKHLLETLDKWV